MGGRHDIPDLQELRQLYRSSEGSNGANPVVVEEFLGDESTLLKILMVCSSCQ
jgi:hypothetical protein